MEVNRLINTYFALVDAADMLLRNAVEQGLMCNIGMKQSTKMAHNRMMQSAKTLAHNYEQCYDEFYAKAFNDLHSWDNLRQDSNYIARIALLLSDRTNNDEEVGTKIEEYINSLPGLSNMDEMVLDLFRMR